ncbi:MAG: hypothetical protein FJ271_00955 [Planctomycetes bacterium]|nr:hypothetical protein [Planctomycetota bacterium]
MRNLCVSIACAIILLSSRASGGSDLTPLLARIKAVASEGKGNPAASAALKELIKQGPEALPEILGAINDASPQAANWLRSAVDAVADRALSGGKSLPVKKLEAFVRDTRHSGQARRLAYEWLVRIDDRTPDRFLPDMLDDPGAELRRDAVAVVIKEAQEYFDKEQKAAASAAYRKALTHARDRDQIQLIAARLKKLGVEVDLTAHFGFINRWQVVGSFDNKKGVGFHTVYPPEKGVDLAAVYKDKDGVALRWQEHETKLPLGLVDFNKIYGNLHGTTAFAFAVVTSPSERPVELRASSNNAIQMFLNGKQIFGREEYHHGTRMDQHVGKGILRAGRNEILVKVSQNEQTEAWAQTWTFQLRVCDHLGAAVPLVVEKK